MLCVPPRNLRATEGKVSIPIYDEHTDQFVAFGPLILKLTVFPLIEVIPIKLHRALLISNVLYIGAAVRLEKYFHENHHAVEFYDKNSLDRKDSDILTLTCLSLTFEKTYQSIQTVSLF